MIDLVEFSGGLSVIALQLRQAADVATLRAYHLALRDETDVAEWTLFCDGAVKRYGWRFLPSVPELLDALREFRGEPSLDGEAVRAYEAVLGSGVYTPEGGTHWNFRTVGERCGRAAAEAFLEAGGDSAFTSTFAEDRRRERFIAAYAVTVRAEPASRLLPSAPEQKALPPAPTQFPSPLALVRKIAKLAGEPLAPDERMAKGTIVATDERLAELRRQAEAILAEPEAVKA